MANSYTVVTFADQEVNAWLQGLGVSLPNNWNQSRYPTPNEIRSTLDRMMQYRVDYYITRQDWQATIAEKATPDMALLVVIPFSGDEASPQRFYFERGSVNVMVDVMNQLSSVCGPLALISSSDATDVVVTPT